MNSLISILYIARRLNSRIAYYIAVKYIVDERTGAKHATRFRAKHQESEYY